MSTNHQHLRAFHAIASEGGVTRAARRLNVSQPTLSQQLKALEVRHGVVLFESRRSPLRLTAAGRELFALTEGLFRIAGDIEEMLAGGADLSSGSLRIGSDSPSYIAQMIALFSARHPKIDVRARVGNAPDVVRWLTESQIDAALASDPPVDGAFTYEPLFTSGLACALPKDHALASLARVPVAELGSETLILREASSKTRAFTLRALADADVQPRRLLELQSRETIREGIALGLGVGVFFTSECPPDVRIAYRPLDTGSRSYQLHNYLVCPSGRHRSPLLRALTSVAVQMRGMGEHCGFATGGVGLSAT